MLDPRLNRNGARAPRAALHHERGCARGRRRPDLPLHGPRRRGRCSSRRPGAVVVDLSGAHRLQNAAAYERWYVFSHPRPDELDRWSTRCPSSWPPSGRLISSPGCYATAALLALAPRSSTRSTPTGVIDAKSGISGAGRSLKPSRTPAPCSRTSPHTAWAGTSTRPRSSRRSAFRLLRPPPAARAPRPDRDVLRARPRGRPPRAARGGIAEPHGPVLPEASRPARARPAHRHGRDRDLRGRVDGPRDRDLRARQPRQGRGRPGRAEREPRVRLRGDGGLRLRGARVSVTAAEGFVASGVHAGSAR